MKRSRDKKIPGLKGKKTGEERSPDGVRAPLREEKRETMKSSAPMTDLTRMSSREISKCVPGTHFFFVVPESPV
jgi:hypothetical protein